MSNAAGDLLKSFDSLAPGDQFTVAAAILRRLPELEYAQFTDDELSAIAAETFVELDREEARRGDQI